ncbi:MAG: hypothetical protein ACI9QR_001869, partial [Flavobacteriaceae bacterium]
SGPRSVAKFVVYKSEESRGCLAQVQSEN